MTHEEKRLIADCRIAVVGAAGFIDGIMTELRSLGFESIEIISGPDGRIEPGSVDVIAENVGEGGSSRRGEEAPVPLILPFDFVNGAGAIVVMPGDDRSFLDRPGLRHWAAKYMAGYCAFWGVDGCEWLRDSLPDIIKGVTSDEALRVATHICARIAANIAVGREVKHFPRFYLCKSRFDNKY